MSKRRIVPLGPALGTADDELDMLALVTPEDIEAAKADGRARMGRAGQEMLETPKTQEKKADE